MELSAAEGVAHNFQAADPDRPATARKADAGLQPDGPAAIGLAAAQDTSDPGHVPGRDGLLDDRYIPLHRQRTHAARAGPQLCHIAQ